MPHEAHHTEIERTDSGSTGPVHGAIWRRMRGLVVLVPCAALLTVAVGLKVDRADFGTARQLGLPGCSVLARTGWPCPSCGMTTSVVAAVQGRFALAFRAQAFGPVLAAVVAVLGLAGLVDVVADRRMLDRLRLGWWWPVWMLGGMILGWLIRLAVGVACGDLPMI